LVRCDQVQWAFLGLSLAAWNAILSIGGAAMISGHLRIADGVHVSGGTAVTASIDKPGRYTGVFPMGEHRAWVRTAVALRRMGAARADKTRDDAAPREQDEK